MNHDINNAREHHNFPTGKIYWKKYWERISIDTINWESFFHEEKSIEKKYWEKINIDTINWEKLCDRSAEHK